MLCSALSGHGTLEQGRDIGALVPQVSPDRNGLAIEISRGEPEAARRHAR
jgi:hypothetical protein